MRLRELRGVMSQAKMAETLGVKQQTYSAWERGEKECGFEVLGEISLRFGVSADWLLGLRDSARAGNVIASGKNSQAAGQNIIAASAESSEIERLKGEVAALERALAMFAKGVK